MTNLTPAIDLTPGTVIIDKAGDEHTIARVRRIDHIRCRIDTREGRAVIVKQTDCFHIVR